MPFDIDNPLPIDLNDMNDDQLKDFVLDPKLHLEPIKSIYVQPTFISPQTRNRMEGILLQEDLTDEQIKKKIDLMAMVKITEVIIDI